MPWFWDLVQLSTEIPHQVPVSTLLKQSHIQVFHNNPQHLNLHAWCLGVDSSKNKASVLKWQREFLSHKDHQGPYTSQSGPYLRNGAEKILHSLCETSLKFFHAPVPVPRCPSTIDGYRMAVGDTLGPTGCHISKGSDHKKLLSSFHRDCSKSSRNLPKWNLSVVLNELTKAPFESMKDTDANISPSKPLYC